MGLRFPLTIDAVVIDLDGTLLDTAPDLAEAANRMLVDLGRPTRDIELIRNFVGNGIVRFVKRVLTGEREAEPDPDLFARALPIFETHYSQTLSLTTKPYPGVIEGLCAMRDVDLPLACITNKASAFSLPILRDSELLPFFEFVISGDTLARKKPDPLPLIYSCEKFGVAPEHLLLIGDSVTDRDAARNAGCRFFWVTYGYNGGRDAREIAADAVISNLLEALPLIEKTAPLAASLR